MSADFTSSAVASGQSQWLRKLTLLAGDDGGNALDLSALQIRFAITSASRQTPRRLEARIFNLSEATVHRFQNEFTQVRLSAGYQDGPFGLLFTGTICSTRRGRDSALDDFLDILAQDGDQVYNAATVQQPIPAGWTMSDLRQALVDTLTGIVLGHTPELADTQMPRAKVLYGATRDHLRAFADTNALDWGIEDGQLQFLAKNGYIPDEIIHVNASTGMVGVPEQTIDGVNVRMLLNPGIKTGRLILLDNAAVTQTSFRQTFGTETTRLPDVDRDGQYKVYALKHSGDTRGQEWYTEAVCCAMNPAGDKPIVVSSSPFVDAVLNGK